MRSHEFVCIRIVLPYSVIDTFNTMTQQNPKRCVCACVRRASLIMPCATAHQNLIPLLYTLYDFTDRKMYTDCYRLNISFFIVNGLLCDELRTAYLN